MAELEAIIEDVKPKRLTILWCDSAISFVDECESAADLHAVKCRGVGGGGGTSVKPVFDWIHDNAHEPPDMFIGLTDCCVTFPTNEPPCPMIWACVDKDGKAPYGEMVYINQRKP
jgi:predicted metal-dependent peptidase